VLAPFSLFSATKKTKPIAISFRKNPKLLFPQPLAHPISFRNFPLAQLPSCGILIKGHKTYLGGNGCARNLRRLYQLNYESKARQEVRSCGEAG
jgi:hypothetical protein